VNSWIKERGRSIALPAYRLYALMRGGGAPPRVIINSIPKAGTHLAKSAVEKLPDIRFSGIHLDGGRLGLSSDDRATDSLPERFAHAVKRVPNGQFITAHLPYQPALADRMGELGFKMVFVIRDPRDVVVSHAKFVARLERHFLYDHYRGLPDDETRLLTSIIGVEPTETRRGLLDIGSRLARYTPWRGWDGAFTCRFEDLIGPSGGGSSEVQRELVRTLGLPLARALDEPAGAAIASAIWSPKADTFRKGEIGDWRNHLSVEHLQAFERLAGHETREMGYTL
jgi:sulfotransferase 6B1